MRLLSGLPRITVERWLDALLVIPTGRTHGAREASVR
jgi:hypothetical protein